MTASLLKLFITRVYQSGYVWMEGFVDGHTLLFWIIFSFYLSTHLRYSFIPDKDKLLYEL